MSNSRFLVFALALAWLIAACGHGDSGEADTGSARDTGSDTVQADGGGPCTSDDECAALLPDHGPCQVPTCTPAGLCLLLDTSTRICDDGSACTFDDACQAGTCVGTAIDCGEATACAEPTCDAETGACGTTPINEGGACPADPAARCGTEWLCQAGDCVCGCQPDCAERMCGLDPTCGVECGPCADEEVCVAGKCLPAGDCDPLCDATACEVCAEGGCVDACDAANEICAGGDCLPAGGCQGFPEAGCCADALLVRCDAAAGAPVAADCSLSEAPANSCGWDADASGYACGGAGPDPSGGLPLACPDVPCPTTCDALGRTCGLHPACPWIRCGTCEAPLFCGPGGACIEQPRCDPDAATVVNCEGTYGGDTSVGSLLFDAYPACAPHNAGGRELVFQFTARAADDVHLALDAVSAGADLDLYVLGPACAAESCVAYGDEDVTFTTTAGETYFLVVDGPPSGGATFSLRVDCVGLCTDPMCADRLCGPAPGDFCAGVTCGVGCAPGQRCEDATGACEFDPCMALGDAGCCDGDTLVSCSDDTLATEDCVAGGQACGWLPSPGGGRYGCGGTGEDPDGVHLRDCAGWTCDNAVYCGAVGAACGAGCPGERCGTCDAGQFCDAERQCDACVCAVGQCGPHPAPACELDCGTCSGNAYCDEDSTCQACSCDDLACGVHPAPACALDCGGCGEGEYCADNACYPVEACVAAGMVGCGDGPVTVGGDTSAGTNRLSSYRGCTALPHDGPEIAYPFSPTCSGPVTASLTDLGGVDLDLFVLEGACRGDGDHCVDYSAGSGDEAVTFQAEADRTYFVVIDSVAGTSGAYSLIVDCHCGSSGRTCANPGALGCGGIETGSTAFAANLMQSYACSILSESGGEEVFVLEPGGGQVGVLSLSGMDGDADLFLLEVMPGESCGVESCVASSTGFADEGIQFRAVEGATYYAVVDGYGGAESAYTLTLDCCDPDCSQVQCGLDPVCGVVDCGTCGPGTHCEAGACVEDRCSGIGYEGCCFGELNVWCEDGRLEVDDCSTNLSCGWGDGHGAYLCGSDPEPDPDGVFPMACPDCNPIRSCAEYGFDCGAHPECPMLSCGACDGENVCNDGVCGAAPNLCDHLLGALTCAAPSVAGRNGADTMDSRVDTYGCAALTENGPEDTYGFLAPASGTYTFSLSNVDAGADLDVFVLGDDCAPTSCVSHGEITATLEAVGGTTYYVVVDGYLGSSANYVLTLGGCPE